MARPLTLKQQLFIAAYLGDAHGSGQEAARKAGYAGNDHTLWVVGSENLRKPAIADAIQAAHTSIAEQGIASKQNRINAYGDRWQKLHAIIAARAAAHADAAPGADTGLLVRTYKQVGQGPGARLVEEWTIDTGLLGEFRALEKQAAQEMGQWVDKVSPTDADGNTLTMAALLQLTVTDHGE